MSLVQKIKDKVKQNVSATQLERLKDLRESFNYLPNCVYDAIRYSRYSTSVLRAQNKNQLRAMLTKNFHIIEKGLSLANPRPGFGQPVVKRLLQQTTLYIQKFGNDETTGYATSALISYDAFNKKNGVHLDFLSKNLSKLIDSAKFSSNGGIIKLSREQILRTSDLSFRELASNRHSIRVFSPTPVSDYLIKEAVSIARKTPSVCNRQTTRVFAYGSTELKKSLLSLQNGNRGFGHLASHVLIVTSDLHCFTGVGERHQAYIDGGLMAMSLVYALQSLGIGSCFLNWSVTADVDSKMRKAAGIPDSHIIITLIAIGNIPEELYVAESPRLPLDEILTLEPATL